MTHTYLRWKDADCNGENIEWEAMSGKSFFAFLNSEQGRGRYFVKLGNDICPEADVIFIEARKEQYEEWYRSSRHHRYLSSYAKKAETLSLEHPHDSEGHCLHEIFADVGIDVETEAMQRLTLELLYLAIESLSPKRKAVILAKYFRYPEMTDERIAALLSMRYEAFHDLKYRAIQELRKYLKKASNVL